MRGYLIMTRGGARYDKNGKLLTGRRKMDPNEKMRPYNTRLKPDIIEYLRDQDNAAQTIDMALRLWIDIEQENNRDI